MDQSLMALLGGGMDMTGGGDPTGMVLTPDTIKAALEKDEQDRRNEWLMNFGAALANGRGGLLPAFGQASMQANQLASKDEGQSVRKLLTTAQLQGTVTAQGERVRSRQDLRKALDADPNLTPEQRQAYLSNPALGTEYLKNLMPQPTKPTDEQREYELAKSQGFTGSFLDYKRSVAAAGRAPDSPSFDFTPFGIGNKKTGQLSPYPGGVGPFHGEGTPQQAMNVVIGYGVKKRANQPTTPEEDYAYAAAYSSLSRPQRYVTTDASGNQVTVEQPAMDLALFPKPSIAGLPGAVPTQAPPGADQQAATTAAPVSPALPAVNPDLPGARPDARIVGTARKELSAPEQKEAMDAAQRVKSANIAIPLLQKAITLNQSAASGIGARVEQGFDTVFNPKQAEDTAEFENIILRQVAESMRAAVGANPTEGERQFLVDIQGALSMPRGQRARLLQNGLMLMQQRMGADNDMLGNIKSGGFRFYENAPEQGAAPPDNDPMGLRK